MLDHIGRRTLDCRTISTFVLDECDEMLSMGFLEDIERVVVAPAREEADAAVLGDDARRGDALRAPPHEARPRTSRCRAIGVSVTDIHHAYYIVSGIARSRDLLKILFAEKPESAIIFCNMRDETTMVAKFLQKQGLDAEPLSSDLSQADRERVMGRMKAHNLRFLCATDVAARGIDISNLSHVINYSVPESPEVYVHRTGRTGRAGKKGIALSLVGPRELGNFRYVRLQFGIKPEERVLPKDDIFVGKLKVPLPPIGAPQPPDPVQILIRGVAADAERSRAADLREAARERRTASACSRSWSPRSSNQLGDEARKPRASAAERTSAPKARRSAASRGPAIGSRRASALRRSRSPARRSRPRRPAAWSRRRWSRGRATRRPRPSALRSRRPRRAWRRRPRRVAIAASGRAQRFERGDRPRERSRRGRTDRSIAIAPRRDRDGRDGGGDRRDRPSATATVASAASIARSWRRVTIAAASATGRDATRPSRRDERSCRDVRAATAATAGRRVRSIAIATVRPSTGDDRGGDRPRPR